MLKEPAEFALWGEFSAGKLIFGAVMADELSSFSSSRACMFRSEAAELAVLEPEQPSFADLKFSCSVPFCFKLIW